MFTCMRVKIALLARVMLLQARCLQQEYHALMLAVNAFKRGSVKAMFQKQTMKEATHKITKLFIQYALIFPHCEDTMMKECNDGSESHWL